MCIRESLTFQDASVTIRAIQQNDMNTLINIAKTAGVFSDEEIEVAAELIRESLNVNKKNNYKIFTAVAQSGETIGYTCFGHTPLTQSTYDLYWIIVSHEHRRHGIGNRLLNFTEEFVKANGGKLLIAETSSQPAYEPARRFYQANQYHEISRIKDYYKMGDDLIVYGKYF